MDTKTLPQNVDISNGFRMVEAGHGSVSTVKFNVVRTRRVLVNATDEQGQPLPKGALVVAMDGAFVTTVVDRGKFFLNHGSKGTALKIVLSDERQCQLGARFTGKTQGRCLLRNTPMRYAAYDPMSSGQWRKIMMNATEVEE